MKRKFISTNMKICLLILFLLSITFYVSGCITLAQSGYKLSDYADELNIDPNKLKFTLFDFNDINFDFNDSYVSRDYTINDSVTEIDLNLNSQDIKVINYDGQDLKVQIKSRNNLSDGLSETENGNKLVLNTGYHIPSNAFISISIPNNFKDKGTLKIITSSGDINASNLSLNTLNLSTASGDVKVNDLNLNYLNVNNSSGDIDFNTITVSNETKLSSASGDIVGRGTLGVVNADTSSGDIDLQLKNSLSNTSLGTASGSITLSIPQDAGYKINYTTISGDLNLSDKQLTFGDESSLINVNTISGDLDVK